MLYKRFRVRGTVQGVFFRAYTRDRGLSQGLTGYVKNLADGSVETLAGGSAEQLASFEAWLWEGSPASRVRDVEVEALEQVFDYRTFAIVE